MRDWNKVDYTAMGAQQVVSSLPMRDWNGSGGKDSALATIS